jgi:flagellar biosynthesis/type III secretory pathway M-ring protein FliF/YscJ
MMVAKLKDIKGIVEVSDYSMYYLIALSLIVLIVIWVIIYILMQPKARKKPTNRQIALKNLQNINYDDTKEIAYNFTLNAPLFINETNKKDIDMTLDKLEIFKYKKDVPKMEKDLKSEIKNMIKRFK